LVLNKGTNYTLEMNSREAAHTFVLFFKDGFVEDVQRCVNSKDEALLDDPCGEWVAPEFVEAIHSAYESGVGVALGGVRRAWLSGGSADELEEEFRRVAVELIRLQNETARVVSAARSLRAATRKELFRRIQRACVLMHDFFTEDMGLDELAAEACLSPHHFHRTFREMHGVTPHQYVQRLRLAQAERLLRETELPIAAVCAKSGFASVPSFTTLFHARFRMPPSRYRRLAPKSKIR
jgi:AraC-like DNA-binding protein